jgi:hypothetical protein
MFVLWMLMLHAARCMRGPRERKVPRYLPHAKRLPRPRLHHAHAHAHAHATMDGNSEQIASSGCYLRGI